MSSIHYGLYIMMCRRRLRVMTMRGGAAAAAPPRPRATRPRYSRTWQPPWRPAITGTPCRVLSVERAWMPRFAGGGGAQQYGAEPPAAAGVRFRGSAAAAAAPPRARVASRRDAGRVEDAGRLAWHTCRRRMHVPQGYAGPQRSDAGADGRLWSAVWSSSRCVPDSHVRCITCTVLCCTPAFPCCTH